jgi:tryptophan synthase alpha chain
MEKFMVRSKECGIDGFILPDMPIEEADAYSRAAIKLGLSTVFLASPNTPETRLRKILDSSSGFLYLVSVYGITGARKSFEDYTLNAIKSVKQVAASKVPVAVGFGISTPAHAKFMIDAGADAIIVGSAIVDKMAKSRSKSIMLKDMHDFARSLKRACKK